METAVSSTGSGGTGGRAGADADAPLRVLLLTGHFPPGRADAGVRAARHVLGLPGRCRVEVVAPEHRDGGWHHAGLLRQVTRRAPVHRAPVPAGLAWETADGAGRAAALVGTRRPLRWRSRAWGEAAWVAGVATVARERLRSQRFDVLLCCAPPHALQGAARRLALGAGVPLVVDLSDTWTAEAVAEAGAEAGGVRGWRAGVRHEIDRRRQRAVLCDAHTIVTATAGQRRLLLEAFPGLPETKLTVVPDGLDAAVAPESGAEGAAGPDDDGRRPRRLAVPGHVERGMPGLIDALEVLSSTDPELGGRVRVQFLDTLDPVLRRQFRRITVPELYDVDGHVPARGRAAVLSRADALVCVVPRATPHRIPHAVLEALGARRPILALAPPGDARDLLAASGVATLVDSVDAAACAAGFKAFVAELEAGNVVATPRPDWLEGLRAATQAGRLAEVLAAAAGRERSAG